MAGADDTIRASDAERDAVVEILRRHTADGRLTMAEFEDRVAEAFAARTRGDLRPVLRELPADPPPERARPPRVRSPRARSPRRAQGAVIAILAIVALVLMSQVAWWMVFPLFWLVGAVAGGGAHGGVCGSRRHRTHDNAWRNRARDEAEALRV